MKEKVQEELPDKDRSQIKQDKEKFLLKIEKIIKAKSKSEEEVLKELYEAYTERVKARLQKNREISSNLSLIEMAKTSKENAMTVLEKSKKEVEILRNLSSTLEKENQKWQDQYNNTIDRHQEERKELNQKMKDEIEKVQEELQKESQRKQMLSQENEALIDRIQQMREIVRSTSEKVEQVLGKEEFDVVKMEEQMKEKIEAETIKIADDEKEKLRSQNKELKKTIAEKKKELEECKAKFEEYKEKIGEINGQINEHKKELEDKSQKIMDIYEENKKTEINIKEIKDAIANTKKQIKKTINERNILASLKTSLENKLKAEIAVAQSTNPSATS